MPRALRPLSEPPPRLLPKPLPRSLPNSRKRQSAYDDAMELLVWERGEVLCARRTDSEVNELDRT